MKRGRKHRNGKKVIKKRMDENGKEGMKRGRKEGMKTGRKG